MKAVIAITGPLAEPHAIETCYGSRLHCWIHHADEPDQPSYRACGECFHVYRRAADLLAEHNKVSRAIDPDCQDEADPERVWCCPLCTHDF